MPQFAYRAKQGPQKFTDGVVEAESQDAAIKKLMQSGQVPVEIRLVEPRSGNALPIHLSWKKYFQFSRRVPTSEIASFTRQIGDLVDAGVPLLKALTTIRNQVRHPYLKEIVQQLCVFVGDGGMLSDGLAQFPTVFPTVYVNIVRSGELSGKLSAVLNRLADFTEKEQETRIQVQTSLLYPTLILLVGGATIFILLTWVIPRITAIFDDLNESLPLPTVILMSVSSLFARFWWVGVLGVAFTILYFERVLSTATGKLWWDGIRLRIPILGDFIKDVEFGRFTRTLGTLLDNGVTIGPALESVGAVMENEVLRQEVKKIGLEVVNGKSLADAVRDSPWFPKNTIQMIAVGEETGQPQKGLYKLAQYYERQAQHFIKSMTSLIEPVLILALGSVVGFVVIAMLMPIFRMNMMVK